MPELPTTLIPTLLYSELSSSHHHDPHVFMVRDVRLLRHNVGLYRYLEGHAILYLFTSEFYALLTARLGINFVSNQLEAQFFFIYVYFYPLHISGSDVHIIRRINCSNTTSGICHSV